jgi:glycosyltransferase involved in cell wall biosynthesis
LSARRIVGISLLHNEEYFTPWALANVLPFCDEFLVVENQSSDRTLEKVEALRSAFPSLAVHSVTDPNQSHRFLERYAGQPVWVFGVDGDEVYDPTGLARLRQRLLSGAFDAWWRISGHMLHVTHLDLDQGWARGHPLPSGTKLYNFGALRSWHEPHRERLHGRNMEFLPGWNRKKVLRLLEVEPWEETDFRSLHLCFYPRTSVDRGPPGLRPNPSEIRAGVFGRAHNLVKNFLARPFSRGLSYKNRRYRRGETVQRGVGGFGRPSDLSGWDPQASVVEEILRILPPLEG